MSEPWLCPRCGRINAPFNPACFCKPEEGIASPTSSEHVNDAFHYMMGRPVDELVKIMEDVKKQGKIANGMIPNFYNARCYICNGIHSFGQSCMTLQNNLPTGGEFI